MNEKILCAAVWYTELSLSVPTMQERNPINCPMGIVFSGHRHVHCIHSMTALTGKRSVITECGKYIQGFLTNKNRFVDRKEALEIAKKERQIIHNIELDNGVGLTSEDIY